VHFGDLEIVNWLRYEVTTTTKFREGCVRDHEFSHLSIFDVVT
jgi:hypothetical protein